MPAPLAAALRSLTVVVLLLCAEAAYADGNSDIFAVSVAIDRTRPTITFTWTQSATSDGTVYRRALGTRHWTTKIGDIRAGQTSFTDSGVLVGQAYEYRFSHSGSKYAYVASGIDLPLPEQRGHVVLLVDETVAAACAAELDLFKRDLVGDGWRVLRHDVPRDDGLPGTAHQAAAIKDIILQDHRTVSGGVKAVILFGRVPVPYSGWVNPDGHYTRAVPADGYYGDVDGTWTDRNTYGGSTGRTDNIAGDGKFDQGTLPSDIDLMVGRIDTWNMSSFSANETELLKRYLAKNHAWRHGMARADAKATIVTSRGWNWGPYNTIRQLGLSAASDNVMTRLRTEHHLYAYFGNTGGYTSVGSYNTGGMAAGDVNAVLAFEGGSYSVDWDVANAFMRSFIAATGTTVASGWSEFPGYYFHHMALGQPVGSSIRTMQNATSADYYEAWYNGGMRAVWHCQMGDPTVRLHPVAPPSAVTATSASGSVRIAWTASADSAVGGYHVYRASGIDAPFARLNSSPITDTAFTDGSPLSGASLYMVRALRLENRPTATGTYMNASQGVFAAPAAGSGNRTPVASADSYATDAGTVLTVAAPGVLANDSDADGDALTASLSSGPSHGTVTLAANGSFTYTPAAGYSGSDSFAYRASDGQASSALATVTLTVRAADRPPTVAFTAPATGATVSGTIAINAVAHDPDAGTGDGAGIARVVFQLRDGSGAVVASHQENLVTYDWNLDTTAYADGSYTLRATATSTSAAGGGSTSTTRAISIANGGPSVLVAINAGGPAFTALDGTAYQADTGFSGGRTTRTSAAIGGGEDDVLYQSARSGDCAYRVAVPDGDYLLTLQFAETRYVQDGKRVFDVRVEGETVASALDIHARVGRFAVHDVVVPVTVRDGECTIEFGSVVGEAMLSALRLESATGTDL